MSNTRDGNALLRTRLRGHRGGSRKSTGRLGHTDRTRHVVVVAAAGGMLATAAITAGVSAALADDSYASDAAAADALPEAAPQVTLVQKVEERVVIRSVRDPRSRLSANGRDLWEISSSGSFDVPSAAIRAYKHAADEVNAALPGCDLPWTLLAGIGRVESDHGRYGGSQLGTDGLPRPAIVGIALDGKGPVAAIRDTDDGEWDGDTVWDRAVGPMQFIPGTWASSGRDGDGDGIENPNDIDDAALAAAFYLCPSSGSIRSDAAMDAAIRSYNNSDYYIDLVEAFAKGYETGVFVIPSPPPAPGVSADAPKLKPKVTKVDKHGKPVKGSKGSKGTGSKGDKGSKSPGTTPAHPAPSTGGPSSSPSGPSTGGPSGGGSSSPSPSEPPTSEPASPFPGAISACGDSFCAGGQGLEWGSLAVLASADFDGDGQVETRREELQGLVGQTVTGAVSGKVVTELLGKAW